MRKWFVGCLVLFFAFMLVGATLEAAQKNISVQKDQSLRRGETRATLDPNMFRDPQVRDAYKIAKEIPWVLDRIYCYCRCEESPVFKHKSLLSCYVDEHASQ